MIYRAYIVNHAWLTLVVRAPSEDEARVLAAVAASQYISPEEPEVDLEWLDHDGPAAVLVDDPS